MCIELGTNALPINILIYAVRYSTCTAHMSFAWYHPSDLQRASRISFDPIQMVLVWSLNWYIHAENLRGTCFFTPDCCDGATTLL